VASTEKLKKYIASFGPLPERDWAFFVSRLQERTFSKKEIILRSGKVEDHVSFLEKGIIRYFVEEEEKDITFDIGFENGFATAYDSFLTRRPVWYNAEALTDVSLWSVTYADLQEIYAKTDAGNLIGRRAAEELYIKKNKRQLSLLKDNAEQRYLSLLTDYPQLIQFIPLKYLASYIGITPQALSRIRKRIGGG
jgi:CRP-like cAMP-binding protein